MLHRSSCNQGLRTRKVHTGSASVGSNGDDHHKNIETQKLIKN